MKSILAKYGSRSGNKSGRFSPEHSKTGKLRRNDSAPGFLPSSTQRSVRTWDSKEPVLGVLPRHSSRKEREDGPDSAHHSSGSEEKPRESNSVPSTRSRKHSHRRRDSEPSQEDARASSASQDGGRKRAGRGLVTESGVATYRAEQKMVLLPRHHTADPSARVINGRLYVIASHDIHTRKNTGPGWKEDNEGSHFDMKAYRLLRFSKDMCKVTDCGDILPMASCPWAERQMWAPDMIQGEDGKIYLYFPARDKRDGLFKLGVAVANAPEGPYKAEPRPIPGTYSIDPAALRASDGSTYLYWGGLMGGQLQNYPDPQGPFVPNAEIPTKGRPLRCRVAKLRPDMKTLASDGVQELVILSKPMKEIKASDKERIFFEGPFVFEREHEGKPLYYILYSTGWSHLIQHATSSKPTGPFKWRGVVLTEPEGWTSQVSIAENRGRWWLLYHDAARSGQTHLRDVKFQEVFFNADGSIKTMDP